MTKVWIWLTILVTKVWIYYTNIDDKGVNFINKTCWQKCGLDKYWCQGDRCKFDQQILPGYKYVNLDYNIGDIGVDLINNIGDKGVNLINKIADKGPDFINKYWLQRCEFY